MDGSRSIVLLYACWQEHRITPLVLSGNREKAVPVDANNTPDSSIDDPNENTASGEPRESRRSFIGQSGSALALLALAVAVEPYLRSSKKDPITDSQIEEIAPVKSHSVKAKSGNPIGVRGEINLTDQHIVTSVLRTAEPLAAEIHPTPSIPDGLTFATVEDYDESVLLIPTEGLLPLITEIRELLARDTRLAALATEVRKAFGDGETLKMMFQQLFPGQEGRIKRKADGSPLLTAREVEVLREVAADRTHEEIGTRLSIAPRTVSTHLNHIYAKLNVQRPMQAVARAISMGYLDLDALDIIAAASSTGARNYSLFETMATSMYDLNRPQAAERLRPLAEFGLLLMILAGEADFLMQNNASATQHPASMVCEVNAKGDVVRSFGADILRSAGGIAIAPPVAARHGFTPGNLYVLHTLTAETEVNLCAITEFTPDGRFVKTFSGGREIGTRLAGRAGINFHPDGRLLVPSGGWTDGILAFRRGGASVRRFANLCCTQVSTGPDELIYAVHYSSAGSQIDVYDAKGNLLRNLIASPAMCGPSSVIVNSLRHLWILYREHVTGLREPQDKSTLRKYSIEGTLLRSMDIAGLEGGMLFVSPSDDLYVACSRTYDVKIFSPEGKEIRRINLRGKMLPFSAAANEDGQVWVVGALPEK
jgi:DNA-binding CsgD family transcriptional regulator